MRLWWGPFQGPRGHRLASTRRPGLDAVVILQACQLLTAPGRGRKLDGIQAWLVPGEGDRMALSTHVPDLAALETLLSVARTGSLNSAAQQAGGSQQAVSPRIRPMAAQPDA